MREENPVGDVTSVLGSRRKGEEPVMTVTEKLSLTETAVIALIQQCGRVWKDSSLQQIWGITPTGAWVKIAISPRTLPNLVRKGWLVLETDRNNLVQYVLSPSRISP
jgi:hypothetical protein